MRDSHDESLKVSVVIPVFNEGDTLASLVDGLVSTLSDDVESFEIVLVDDGSTDNTSGALHEAARRYPETVRGARHLQNRGNGASLRTGIRIARGDVVVTMDADGQHNPGDIATLLAGIPPNDLVVGARTEDYVGPWSRGVANRFFNWFASYLSRRDVKDLTSGFRAMRRKVVLHFLPLFPEGFSAPTTTTLSFLKAGYSVAFVPIHVGERTGGQSKIRPWRDGARFVGLIIRMIMLYDPMRIFTPTSIVMVVLGAFAWLAGIQNASRLVFPNSTIFLFSAGLTIFLLGLVSSQIAANQVHYFGDENVQVISGVEEGSLEPGTPGG